MIICKCALLPRLRVTGLVRGVRAYPGPVTHAILGQTFSMIIVTSNEYMNKQNIVKDNAK